MKIIKKVFIYIPTILIICFIALIIHVSISLQKHKVPSVFGYSFHIVLTGSMEPEIKIGDFIISKRQNTYEIGDTVSFYYDYNNDGIKDSITHEIIEKTDTYYTLHGIAAKPDENQVVEKDEVYGKVIFRSTSIGKLFTGKTLANKKYVFLVLSIALAIFALFQVGQIIKIIKQKEE